MTHILESLELADLSTINRVLRKRGLTAKMVDTTPDTVSLRVSFLPPPAVKEAPLLEAANVTPEAADGMPELPQS